MEKYRLNHSIKQYEKEKDFAERNQGSAWI